MTGRVVDTKHGVAAVTPPRVRQDHVLASGRTRQERGRTIVEQITAVHSVDLVSDPATTSGLFESVGHPSRAPDNRTFLERLRNKPSAESVAEFAEAVLGRAVWKRPQQEIHESAAQLGRRYRS